MSAAPVVSMEAFAALRGARELVEAFIEASLDGRAHLELAREFSRIADAFRERARAHYVAADACLSAATRCARVLARNTALGLDAMPPELEDEIRAALDARDSAESGEIA